jgi:hypothetical protein
MGKCVWRGQFHPNGAERQAVADTARSTFLEVAWTGMRGAVHRLYRATTNSTFDAVVSLKGCVMQDRHSLLTSPGLRNHRYEASSQIRTPVEHRNHPDVHTRPCTKYDFNPPPLIIYSYSPIDSLDHNSLASPPSAGLQPRHWTAFRSDRSR